MQAGYAPLERLRFHKILPAALLLVPALLAGGCAAHADRLRDVRAAYYANSVEAAGALLDQDIKKYGRESDAFKLDRAMVELAAGRPAQAERILREVRDSFDHFSQPAVGEKAASMLSDDTHLAYAGEDYEKILVRAFLALSNLMTGGGDANAYALQVSDVQEQIIQSGGSESEQNPKLAYQRVALGEYIHGMLREETHADYNDAARSWTKVCSWEPAFPYARGDVERAVHGHHSQPGHGVLYVFTLVGRGPYKVEKVEPASTIAMFAASAVVSNTAKHSVPPSVAPIKVPKVVVSPNPTRAVLVSVDRQPAGATATITDVGRLAVAQYDAIYPQVVVRAVLRRAAKEGVVYGAKEALKTQNNSLANLAMDLGGVAWEATESADTRCWGLLPDRIQVLRLELPAGEHQVGLRPDAGFVSPVENQKTVRISDGRNTYLLATFVDGRLIGNVLSNGS
jgi:uncharacterized protein